MVINIAVIRNMQIRKQKIEFENDKDYIEIPLMNNEYNRAKSKEYTEKLKEKCER